MNSKSMVRASDADRFWKLVDVSGGADDCWNWQGSIGTNGYGKISIRSRDFNTHRVAWELTHGPIPSELCVLHRCDNRRCVRPSHLWLGTSSENTADRHAKGRDARGESHGSRTHPERLLRGDRHPARLHPERLARGERQHLAKLTVEMVVEIRSMLARGERGRDIARRFGVSEYCISDLRRGKTWRHVSEVAS